MNRPADDGRAPSSVGSDAPKGLFSPLKLRRLTLPHRILRAATFDNLAEPDGCASAGQAALFATLARGGVGTIITGFSYVSQEGRAMQPFQAGIDHDDKILPWRRVVEQTKAADPATRVILQIAHTGRQTVRAMTGRPVVGAGPVRCTYFLSRVRTLREGEIAGRIREFIAAAIRAERAGFDAVQIHAAHGYLIHQFLSPYTNRRRDRYGADPLLFLREVVNGIREKSDIPILLKLSGAEDRRAGIQLPLMQSYVRQIDDFGVDALEISYGTMEWALNIIRGGHPLEPVLRHNPLFNRWGRVFKIAFRHVLYPFYKRLLIPYGDLYNLENACAIKEISRTPVLVTGGIRSAEQIDRVLRERGIDGVTLCRPFICEPDLVHRLRHPGTNAAAASRPGPRFRCTSCNLCTIMCDSRLPLQCWLGRGPDILRV